MLLFLDTETTGLYHYDKRSDDPAQPKIIELAALLTDDTGKEYGAFNVLIDHGVEIPAEATAVHGITAEDCSHYGVYKNDALNLLAAFMVRCNTIIGHNLSFDLKMIRSTYGKEYYDRSLYASTPHYCTMLNSTNICKIPKKNGHKGNKWPRLEEAYRVLLGKEMTNAHRAMGDVRATAEIYFKLMELNQ